MPGHEGVLGNEAVAEHVKATAVATDIAPHMPNTNGPTALPLQNKGGLHLSWPVDCRAASTWRKAVLLARLRPGHTPLLKAYANQIATVVDPKCPSCGEEPQTVEH